MITSRYFCRQIRVHPEKVNESSGVPSRRILSEENGDRSLGTREPPAIGFLRGTAQIRRTVGDKGAKPAANPCGGPKWFSEKRASAVGFACSPATKSPPKALSRSKSAIC